MMCGSVLGGFSDQFNEAMTFLSSSNTDSSVALDLYVSEIKEVRVSCLFRVNSPPVPVAARRRCSRACLNAAGEE